jgi:hypothetical protein
VSREILPSGEGVGALQGGHTVADAMSKLPQTDELPHADEGFDPARVEEAFATFADRVRELESVASDLRAELHSLRAERSAPSHFVDEEWPVYAAQSGAPLAADWVGRVPPPLDHGFTVPRLALEGAFLLLVAFLAGIADLSVEWIVLVMAVAWGLVALAEWAAAAKRSRWRLDEVAPPVVVPGAEAADSTGPWDMPVVEATAVAPVPAPASESKTIVTKLPADAVEAEDAAPEPAQTVKRRLSLRRRKQPAETGSADPWDT